METFKMRKRIFDSGLGILIIVAAIIGFMLFRGAFPPFHVNITIPGSTSSVNTSGTASGGGNTSTENQLAQQLFNQINSDRAAQGLPAYTWNDTLAKGAYQHNVTMTTTGCGLAHQCPNEPTLRERMTNEGLIWQACGENIGYTSPDPDLSTAIKQNIEGGMLAEKPPDDGHRKNLLSTSFHQIGIAVLIDDKGIAWITEDFTD
jgi:uncharacterized protein YkwD